MESETTGKAWYGKWEGYFHAVGPYRFDEPVTMGKAIEYMTKQAGSAPVEVWKANVNPRAYMC